MCWHSLSQRLRRAVLSQVRGPERRLGLPHVWPSLAALPGSVAGSWAGIPIAGGSLPCAAPQPWSLQVFLEINTL